MRSRTHTNEDRRTKTEGKGTVNSHAVLLVLLDKPRVMMMMMIQKKKMTLSLTGAYVILSSVAGASAAPPTATERIIKG
jgi:hypothetical protein